MARHMLAAATAALTMAVSGGAAQAQNLTFMRMTIGSNPAGSVYYLIGGGFAKMWLENLMGRTTVQPHSGSCVFFPLIHYGEVTWGLNSSLDSALA
ncbi:MAG: hypothetical protein AB7J19_10275, partial [Beijerinckiaceae bacterium]